MGLGLTALGLEVPLWPGGLKQQLPDPSFAFRLIPPWLLALLLAGGSMVHAALIIRALDARSELRAFCWPWRVALWVAAGLPLVNFLLPGTWRWLEAHPGSRWAPPQQLHPAGLSSCRPSAASTGRRGWVHLPLSMLTLAFAQLVGFVLVPLSAARLAAAGPFTLAGERQALLAGAALTHLTSFVVARLTYLDPSIIERWGARRRRLAWLWLLPSPFSLLGLALEPGRSLMSSRNKTLTYRAMVGRRSVDALPSWSQLVRALRWSLPEAPALKRVFGRFAVSRPAAELTDSERRLLGVARWKIAALSVDSLALGWLLGRGVAAGAAGEPRLVHVLWLQLGSLGVWFGIIFLLRVAQLLLALLARSEGPKSLERTPLLRYAAWAGMVLSAGLPSGLGLWRGATGLFYISALLASSAFMLGLLGLLTSQLSLAAGHRRDPRDAFFFVPLYFALEVGSGALGFLARDTHPISGGWLLLLLPWLWGAWLAYRRYPELLEPFTLGDLANPRLPRRLRWALGGLLASAALPLGGLMAPLWLPLRNWLAKAAPMAPDPETWA
ncbi:MAG TPA: hypothetical protein PK413_03090 [Thermoanaerobaculia bacterium]|nr:hypothetical protein [Thermoanaerobaculia bacterium]